jgi:hypothetical protein
MSILFALEAEVAQLDAESLFRASLLLYLSASMAQVALWIEAAWLEILIKPFLIVVHFHPGLYVIRSRTDSHQEL